MPYTPSHPDPSVYFDDLPEAKEMPKNVSPLVELGVSGIKRAGGYVDEEFLPALRGRKSVQVFREMSQNDSIVGALLFAVEQLLKGIDFKVIAPDETPEAQEAKEFLESCMDDMSHSWGDFIAEVLSCLTYGWSWHEIVYKKRVGPWEKDGKRRSKYTDGKIGWRKLPIRSQETLLRWVFDDTGGIQGMVQMAPPKYQTVILPIDKSLLFRPNIAKGNPEGRSILRTAYRSWYLKKRLEEFEAIGVERDLAGMPVAKVPADYLEKNATEEKKAMVNAFRKMVRGVRRDENEGLILPNKYDLDTKQPLFEFELLNAGGSRTFDTNSIIGRYEQRILMSVLADFILVGHEGVGSYSMHTDKSGLFRSAINSIADNIADTLNRHAVPRLFEANGWKLPELPKFEPVDVDPPDLQQLSAFISATGAAGMQWFPDPDLEQFMREIARLPEMSDDQEAFKREQYQMDQVMGSVDSQMQILGMKQKAELAAQGYSPEQAQMLSEQPNDEMIAQQQMAELNADEMTIDHPARIRQMEQEAMANDGMIDSREQAEIDAEKMKMEEERAQSEHGRTKESMMLKDKSAAEQHKRQLELERFKARESGKSVTRDMNSAKLKAKLDDQKARRDALQAKRNATQKPPPKGKK